MSISGPYRLLYTNSSGAAYSGDPQCVARKQLGVHVLLSPKSIAAYVKYTYIYLYTNGNKETNLPA